MTKKTKSNTSAESISVEEKEKNQHKDGSKPKKNTLGSNLKSKRISMGLSQQDVVKMFNKKGHSFTMSTVSKIETGDRSLYDTELIDFLDIYSTSLEKLLNSQDSSGKK